MPGGISGQKGNIVEKKYKIGWKDLGGMRHYITVDTKSEMLAEVADKTCFSDHVSVEIIPAFKLDKSRR